MDDEIRLDRDTFKALAAETRVAMLKSLSRRRMTGAELAQAARLSPSTVKEHLDRLEKAGLIEQEDEGRKWKYYSLTFKGRQITAAQRPSMRVWIVLGLSIIALAFTTLNIFYFGNTFAPQGLAAQPEALAVKSAYGAEAGALNAPQPAALDQCGAAPNSCLSETREVTAVAADSAAPEGARTAYSAGSEIPTQRQVSTTDLAIEASLLLLVLGLGYYAITQRRKAAP
jgi:DNA-binding transcriptional ArsR family regulator